MVDFTTWLNVIAIIVVGLIGFQSQWQMARATREPWRWIKFGLALICLVWASVYFFVLLNFLRGIDDQQWAFFRSWIIRPMILLTITLVASSGIARRKTL